MEERAALTALDGLMDKNCCLIQEIEQGLARLTAAAEQIDVQPDMMPFFSYPLVKDTELIERVMNVLNSTNPSSVTLDEAKADQMLSLTNNMLLLVSSQTPAVKKLINSYSSEVCLDPDTAHPKLIISSERDSATYTDIWQELADLPGRFDTTLNVISLQGFNFGRHYWEVNVTEKTYWELGVTYPTIPRKGTGEECWLGRGIESWCVEFFDGEYTAWHGGVAHQLPVAKHLCQIGILCSFPAGLVTFIEANSTMPLFSFCAGTFSECLHLALCPGHGHNGANTNPIVICKTSNR
ncbi:probable E3 ubiquitin-protein ligase TRIML1 [Thalassophryne amazonica]|uniref:probable E3 ubiquitin-protein ligase TRIML1 n=1 Tax=Thalassophryne amazonica TaxID=390379 RepID=UPI00147095E2|nr:probable E3 ubiquitin-protein ligase TRIML1 [Thalassophryne amazonica]